MQQLDIVLTSINAINNSYNIIRVQWLEYLYYKNSLKFS